MSCIYLSWMEAFVLPCLRGTCPGWHKAVHETCTKHCCRRCPKASYNPSTGGQAQRYACFVSPAVTQPSEQPTNAREMWTWPRQKEIQDQAEWHWKKNKNIDKMDFLTSSQPISTRFYFTKILLVFIVRGQVLSWVIFMFASNSPIREGFKKRGRNLPLPSVYRAENKIST